MPAFGPRPRTRPTGENRARTGVWAPEVAVGSPRWSAADKTRPDRAGRDTYSGQEGPWSWRRGRRFRRGGDHRGRRRGDDRAHRVARPEHDGVPRGERAGTSGATPPDEVHYRRLLVLHGSAAARMPGPAPHRPTGPAPTRTRAYRPPCSTRTRRPRAPSPPPTGLRSALGTARRDRQGRVRAGPWRTRRRERHDDRSPSSAPSSTATASPTSATPTTALRRRRKPTTARSAPCSSYPRRGPAGVPTATRTALGPEQHLRRRARRRKLSVRGRPRLVRRRRSAPGGPQLQPLRRTT